MTNNGKNKWIILLFCFFLGWFGIDKLYVGGGTAWKIALIKFALCFVVVGVIWNFYDMVCAILGKYELNPIND